MSSVPTRDSPDKPNLQPSFRKPSNDGAHRKYRHHSPADGSESSSSGGSPRHEKSIIQVNSLENRNNVSDDRARMHHGKESERDRDRFHSSRVTDSHRYPDSYRSYRDYQNNDEGGGYRRRSDDEDRNSVRYSGRELRSIRSDRDRDNSFERSKESRNADRHHTKDKFEGHRSRGMDIEVNSSADHRYYEKECTRAASGSQKISSIRDNKWADEWERPRERDDRDERRIHCRSLSDYKKEHAPTPEGSRGHAKDSFMERESDCYLLKENQRKEINEHHYNARKRRYNDRDTRKCGDKYSHDPNENRMESFSFPVFMGREDGNESHANKNSNAAEELSSPSEKPKLGQSVTLNEGKPSSSAKQVKEGTGKFSVGPPASNINSNESGQELNAAKVAAIQAAELVNRNLVGTGLMSNDQKKKLLWGSKKSNSDESGTRWDLQLFTDRERQEKFNKLMGVKGDGIPPERKPDEKDVEKQKELQLDLEKQYTAGLRRRDGRTVGLGL